MVAPALYDGRRENASSRSPIQIVFEEVLEAKMDVDNKDATRLSSTDKNRWISMVLTRT